MPKITLENGTAVEISQESYDSLQKAISDNPYRKLYDDLLKIDNGVPRVSSSAAHLLRRYAEFIVETTPKGESAIRGSWSILRNAVACMDICGQVHDVPVGFCDKLIEGVKERI